jgi:transmembrane sensor
MRPHNIEYLLNRFKEKTINREELELLRSYFNSDQPGNDLNTHFDKVWAEKHLTKENFNIEKNFDKILSQLNVDSKNKPAGALKLRRFIIRTISYAAIFILGIGFFSLYNINKDKSFSFNQEKFVTITIPYGSKSKVDLPDGSKVILNSGSFLKYPVTFGADIRKVEFNGEAYFDIAKNKKVPFIVSTSGIHIKVLGTTFNVKSYPEDKSIETTLVTGSIEIFNEKNKQQPAKHIYLKPNQKISIPKNNTQTKDKIRNIPTPATKTEKITPKAVLETDVNSADYIAWKDNKLVFDNERFCDIMLKMERWYDVSIEIHSPEISNERFSGKFEKETLQQSLDAISLIAPIRYEIVKKKVEIFKQP